MPHIGTPDEHVTAIHGNAYAMAMASLQNEPRVFVELQVSSRDQLDCPVLNDRVHDRDIDDHEVARERAINVVMLSMAPWEIEIAAYIWHAQHIRVQLFDEVNGNRFVSNPDKCS